MSTTSTDLVYETERYLFSGAREAQNKLSGPIASTTATSVTFLYDLGAIATGAVIAVDLELMYVWAVTNAAGKTITVERGWLGSTAATHADAAIVTVNPKFSGFSILDALNAELDALSSPENGLFRVQEVTFTYQGAKYGYDLTDADDFGVLGALEARKETPGPAKDWPKIGLWDIRRNSDTDDFPSGFAVVLREDCYPGRDIRVLYAAPFIRFTALGENIASQTGLPPTANDILPLGAALRLQSLREAQRNFNDAQGDSRRAEEVPVGAQIAGARPMEALWRRRIAEEARRLRKQYPHQRRVA